MALDPRRKVDPPLKNHIPRVIDQIGQRLAVLSLDVMDDWDENDRAAVNLISDQVGIAGGGGRVEASVVRVTIADDDPVVRLLAETNTLLRAMMAMLAESYGLKDGPVQYEDAAGRR